MFYKKYLRATIATSVITLSGSACMTAEVHKKTPKPRYIEEDLDFSLGEPDYELLHNLANWGQENEEEPKKTVPKKTKPTQERL